MKLYRPKEIDKMTDNAVNKAYSALRSVANKRIERTLAQGLSRHTAKFPTIQQINESSYGTVRSALADVSKFLRSPRTTVTGAKKFIKEFREIMTENGYGDLVKTNEDVLDLTDYMDYLREQYSDKLFDSGDALDVLQQGRRLNIPIEKLQENYELFASNLDKMEKLRKSPHGREFSQERIDKLIKQWL